MLEVLINNRYLLASELGRGGMGVVYRAHDKVLERDVAVKVLWTTGLGSQGRARLLREAQAAARLNHPNIINVYDAGDADGLSYIVMELLDGDSLYEHKPGTLEETLDILRQVCDALQHAHDFGIIHRDLKPENVIVTSKGVAKLTDFGLSRSITARISQEGIIVGTVYYLAPEQAMRQDVDARADLYALGVMMYELLAGRLPFTADDPLGVISQHLNAPVVPPSTYNAEIPPALEAIIMQLLSKRPEDRPASAAVVRHVLDHLDEPGDLSPLILGNLSPLDRLARGRLVGRQEEMEQVRSLWRGVLSAYGGANTIIISGEPGVGKTPIIKEIRSLAQVSGGRAMLGECYARGSAPYTPVTQILHALQPLPEGLPDLVLNDLMALTPDLVTKPMPVSPPLSPLSEQQRLFESLFAVFATVAERQPLAIIVEDAQWADGNTLFLMRHIARRARATRLKLMVVLSYRTEELEQNSYLSDVLLDLNQEQLSEQVELRPFSREQTRDLLATMFNEEISDSFLDAIYRVTEGNLYFIEEICKALIEEGKLFSENGKWHFSGIDELELPNTVRMALHLRINRLPQHAQDLLRLASVIGREFDFQVLRLSCEQQDEDALIEALELAERAQLINETHITSVNETGGNGSRSGLVQFAFAHALIPATLRDDLSALRRQRMHRRVAMALETVHPEALEQLAYHYSQAGDQEKARHYTIRAGDRASKLYATKDALRFFNEALRMTPQGHPDRFHIFQARARVYNVLAQRDEQRADIQAMVELAEQENNDTMRCDALIALADLFINTENSLSQEPARHAVTLAQHLQDPVREGHALRILGWSAWIRHDYHESLGTLETAVTRFRQAGMPSQAAEVLHMLSLVTGLQGLGELSVSQKYAEDAIQLARLAGDPRQEAISLRRLAIVYIDQKDYARALNIAQQALALHRELGDRNEECSALNVMGVILNALGQDEDARVYFFQSHNLALAISSNIGFWISYANIQWMVYRSEGNYEEGLVFADAQLARQFVQKDPFLHMNILNNKAEILSELGQFHAAMEHQEQAMQIADQYGSPVVRANVRIRMAKNWAELGDFAAARYVLESARELAKKVERPNDAAALLVVDAEISRREWEAGNRAQLARAARQIEQALALLRGTDWSYELAYALQTATWIAQAQNKFDEALGYSTEAMELLAMHSVRPEGYEYTHACALWANGQEEQGNELLEKAYRRVIRVANLIKNEDLRKSWLESVYINRQILKEWEMYD